MLPLLVFLEAKSPTFFFLILNELHSATENFTFLTKTNYIPYENTLHSLREYTSFFTGIHFILVRNVVGSRIEHKILSAGNKYFPGLKILYSRQGNASISVRNKIMAISMEIYPIFNHLIIKVGVNHYKNRSKNSKMRKLKSEED